MRRNKVVVPCWHSNVTIRTSSVPLPLLHITTVNRVITPTLDCYERDAQWWTSNVPVGVTTHKTPHISIAPFVMSARFEAGREFPTQAL